MDQTRADRLKAALRQNLRRRKAAGRPDPKEKASGADRPEVEPGGSKPSDG